MSSLCSFKRFLVQNGNAVDIKGISSQPSPPPPPAFLHQKGASGHIVFRRLSKRFSKGLFLEGLTRLLLKSKDSKSIVNARQRVAGDNVYFKASQSVLARVFSITCLFACEDVCYQLAVIPIKYYIKLHGSWVLGLRSSAFGLQVFSLQFKDNCLLRLFMTKFTLFNCHYYYFFFYIFSIPYPF